MEELLLFINTYGWQLALIAVLGIAGLGALKYLNVFDSIEKEKRKPLYLVITVGFSIVASAIHLAVVDQFELNYLVGVAGAIYTLNQVFYALYETTTLRELLAKLFAFLSLKIQAQHNKTNTGGQ